MDFSDVSKIVFAAYDDGSYREALAAVQKARPQFPDRESTLTFWEACLLSLTGEPHAALACLETGLDHGLSWHRRMLSDPDLDAARELPGWQQFEDASSERAETLSVDRPPPLVRQAAEPVGTIVALHGAGHVPADFKAEWVDLIPDEWTVVAPAGDVALSEEARAWSYDLDTHPLTEEIENVDLLPPVLLVGFSQGASLAAKTAWNDVLPVSGLLLSAATMRPDLWSGSRKTPVPLYAVVGTEDAAYVRCTAIAGEMQTDGVPVYLDVREGLGHRPPDDLEDVIRSGIDWLLAQRGAIP